METLKSILISVALFLITFVAITMFLLLTGIGHRLLETVAGFVAWVIINLACL